MIEQVILVDRDDNAIGTMEKMEAHQKGLLHRAFSVFIFNDKNEMLLHKRAESKYHSGGLWTNACCSHPRVGETTEQAAHRRLVEEMGFDCPIQEVFDFTYEAQLNQGLSEHEFDHVFVGQFNGYPKPNPDEVGDWKYMSLNAISIEIKEHPERFTVWFIIAFEELMKRGFRSQ